MKDKTASDIENFYNKLKKRKKFNCIKQHKKFARSKNN